MLRQPSLNPLHPLPHHPSSRGRSLEKKSRKIPKKKIMNEIFTIKEGAENVKMKKEEKRES